MKLCEKPPNPERVRISSREAVEIAIARTKEQNAVWEPLRGIDDFRQDSDLEKVEQADEEVTQ
jgi:hypothetical protein